MLGEDPNHEQQKQVVSLARLVGGLFHGLIGTVTPGYLIFQGRLDNAQGLCLIEVNDEQIGQRDLPNGRGSQPARRNHNVGVQFLTLWNPASR